MTSAQITKSVYIYMQLNGVHMMNDQMVRHHGRDLLTGQQYYDTLFIKLSHASSSGAKNRSELTVLLSWVNCMLIHVLFDGFSLLI